MPTSYLAPGTYIEEVPSPSVAIEGVSTSTLGMVGPTERGPSEGAQLVTSWAEFQRIYGGPLSVDETYFTHAVKGFFANAGQLLYCARVVGKVKDEGGNLTPAAVAVLTLDPEEGAGAESVLLVKANGAGPWGNNVFVRVDKATRAPAGASCFRLTVLYFRNPPPVENATLKIDPFDPAKLKDNDRRDPDIVEDYDYVEVDPTTAHDVVSKVNGSSAIVRVTWPKTPAMPKLTTGDATTGYMQLTNGNSDRPVASDYVGSTSGVRTGLAALEAIDDISLLAIPDHTHPNVTTGGGGAAISDAMIIQCEKLRNRFSIFAVPPDESDVEKIVTEQPTTSSFAAIYYPSIHVLDDVTSAPTYMSVVGHMAGIYARTDNERGVQKAPANTEILGILTQNTSPTEGPLQFPVTVGDMMQLNPRSVCALADKRSSGQGVRVWGARTLSADPQWRYIQVRRTFIYLEQSIERGTQWVVFEDNVESVWARLRRSISNFLLDFWRAGGLAGDTPAEAYFVRCDRTTMTPSDIDAGRLICEIGVAAVKPAEFVIFRFSQLTLQAIS